MGATKNKKVLKLQRREQRMKKFRVDGERNHMLLRGCMWAANALLFISLLGFAFTTNSVNAQTSPNTEAISTKLPDTLTIADLTTYAYDNNPAILEARKEWEAEVEQ
ncbi:MAG: hypothetical protein U9Q05_14435, partial [Thermodesulfobacteriota bacterium]|nr:hypothetical protein [Thermodesulfobacteriota bacterium]